MLNLELLLYNSTKMNGKRSRKIFSNISDYIKLNWGIPFLITFCVLLIGAGFSIASNISILSDWLSEFAFYALVIGVILQIICSLKFSKHSQVEAV
jgi:hypothetical protein